MPPDVKEAFVEFMKILDHPHQWYGGRTYAQHGDDLAIINLFKCLRIERPSYLDIGAHHPFELSNTALLYARGSRGINVEANPAMIENFQRLRPEDVNVCAAVMPSPRSGSVQLLRVGENSGLNSVLPIDGFDIVDTVEVPACTVNELVRKFANSKWPDLLSIDVEGMDLPILCSANFDGENSPKVICAEFVSPGGDICAELRARMAERGYAVHSFCGSNMLLVRKDLMELCR
jgi:FkbM family methyltransferase